MQDVRVPATDGLQLAATLHRPPATLRGGDPRALVVVAPATGVARRYYRAFAADLAGAGFAALTLDYRGTGGSRPARLSGFEAAMHQWGERDLAGALEWLTDRFPGRPLLVVGHSVGGQVLGFARSIDRVRAVLSVASQSGHWRLWPGARRLQMGLYMHVVVPGLSRALGRLPFGLVGGEDLPAGVALEWSRWSRDPRYLQPTAEARGAQGYGAYAGPWRALCFTDDWYAPPRAVETLLTYYPRARAELRLVAPGDVGARRIGHFGFFRPAFRDTLWREARAWLEERAA